jgi:hypothetical protein
MKREADGEMGSPQKRSRRGDDEVRLLIPSKVAGSIIGKGGQNITKLRSQVSTSEAKSVFLDGFQRCASTFGNHPCTA